MASTSCLMLSCCISSLSNPLSSPCTSLPPPPPPERPRWLPTPRLEPADESLFLEGRTLGLGTRLENSNACSTAATNGCEYSIPSAAKQVKLTFSLLDGTLGAGAFGDFGFAAASRCFWAFTWRSCLSKALMRSLLALCRVDGEGGRP